MRGHPLSWPHQPAGYIKFDAKVAETALGAGIWKNEEQNLRRVIRRHSRSGGVSCSLIDCWRRLAHV